MSAQPIEHDDRLALIAGDNVCVQPAPGPYAAVPTSVLGDTLEAQYERGEPLEPLVVFELLDRLVRAEGLGMPIVEG
jgi:hypothetical protein